MSAFAMWLSGFVKAVLTWLYNQGIGFVQSAMDIFVEFALVVLHAFPDGGPPPTVGTAPVADLWTQFIGVLNWIFPIQFLLSATSYTVAAFLIYFLIAPVARWVKLLT